MSVMPTVDGTPLAMGPLATALVAGTLPAALTTERPASLADWQQHLETVREPMMGRQWADTLREAMRPSGAAAARLARVSDGQGVVVTTGQQPGLFGGPLYTLIKALSALALADRIEAVTGVPCAPVFWAATDDADFAEGAATWLPSHSALAEARLTAPPPDGTMMSHAFLGDISAARTVLRQATAGAAWPELIRAAESAYRDGATVGNAYVDLLRAMLQPLGITVLNAAHPSVRHQSAPLLRRALAEAAAVDQALTTRTAALRSHGYTPQVERVDDRALVFVVRNGVKERARISQSAALLPRLSDDLLSPNVLLRPVIERALLPIAAYVAGPGELAYFAQVSAVADALHAPQPLAVPRASARVIVPTVARTLERYQVPVAALRDTAALTRQLAAAGTADGAVDAIAALRAQIRRTHDQIASQHPAMTRSALDGVIAQLTHRADRLERRVLAATKQSIGAQLAEVQRAQHLLWPRGVAQERVVNPLPWLARFGAPLMDALQRACADGMADVLHAEG
jgi:bacillithiol synthase